MFLDQFFEIMGQWPVNMPQAEIKELVAEQLWQANPEAAAELALRRCGKFDAEAYLRLNPDVARAGGEPFSHYIRYGIDEGRRFTALGSPGRIQVSAILRLRGKKEDLEASMFSLLSQTLKGIEIIIVDESRDDVEEIIGSYLRLNKDFKHVKVDAGNFGAGLNLGLDHASGEYVGFVEAGDSLHPNMYADMYIECVRHGLDFVKCGHEDQDGKQKPPINNRALLDAPIDADIFPSSFEADNALYPALYDLRRLRSHGVRIAENIGAIEAMRNFWFEIYMLADKFKFLESSLYKYGGVKENV